MRRLLELLRLHVHAMLGLLLRVLVVIELLLVAHAAGIHGLLAMVLELLLLVLVLRLRLRLRHVLLHLRREVSPSRMAVHLLLLLLVMLIEVMMLLLLLLLLFIVA